MPAARKILIASDHAGFRLKAALQKILTSYNWVDLGPYEHERVDYPDYAEALGRKIYEGEAKFGVLICGSGIGMSITANKFRGVRAALVENGTSARLAREHNNSNVLCLGARFLAPEYAAEIAHIFLETPFTDQDRHKARIDKITKIEKGKKA
jgi:RpiB/LacA/LacB family sugar-phosphate isomerase